MKFAQRIYISDNIEYKKRNKLINKIKRHKTLEDIYCLCVDNDSKFPLEIIKANEMYKCVNNRKNYIVIGIAKYEEYALELTRKIIQETHKKYGNVTHILKLFMEC